MRNPVFGGMFGGTSGGVYFLQMIDWLIFLAFVMVTSYGINGINIPAVSVSRVAWKRNFGGICVFLSHHSVLETLT